MLAVIRLIPIACCSGPPNSLQPNAHTHISHVLLCISVWLHGTVGNSSYTLQHALTLLPYKLLYAARLAEHGLISEAAQYCGAIQQAMGAIPKLPPGLSVCMTFTKDLLDRLQSYAAVSSSVRTLLLSLVFLFWLVTATTCWDTALLMCCTLLCWAVLQTCMQVTILAGHLLHSSSIYECD